MKRISGMFSALGVALMMPMIVPMSVVFGVKKLINKDSIPTFIVTAGLAATGISLLLVALGLTVGIVTGAPLVLTTLGCYFGIWAVLGAFIFHVNE